MIEYKYRKEIEEFCKEKYCNIFTQAKEEFEFIKEDILERLLVECAVHNSKINIIRYLIKYKKQGKEKVYEDIMKNFKEHIFLILEAWDNE